jgi:hypothetical protein
VTGRALEQSSQSPHRDDPTPSPLPASGASAGRATRVLVRAERTPRPAGRCGRHRCARAAGRGGARPAAGAQVLRTSSLTGPLRWVGSAVPAAGDLHVAPRAPLFRSVFGGGPALDAQDHARPAHLEAPCGATTTTSASPTARPAARPPRQPSTAALWPTDSIEARVPPRTATARPPVADLLARAEVATWRRRTAPARAAAGVTQAVRPAAVGRRGRMPSGQCPSVRGLPQQLAEPTALARRQLRPRRTAGSGAPPDGGVPAGVVLAAVRTRAPLHCSAGASGGTHGPATRPRVQLASLAAGKRKHTDRRATRELDPRTGGTPPEAP